MNRKKIAILDDYQNVALSLAEWDSLGCSITAFNGPFGGLEEAANRLAGFDIVCLMRERTPFPRALFERLPDLELLVTTGVGNAAVDLVAAKDHGVTVCHTAPNPSGQTTTELTWGLILACARQLPREDRNLRAGRWQTTLGSALHGKTLGVLGLGRVGSSVAAVGRAFGMRTIAWSPNLTESRAREQGVEYAGKDEIFSASDVLSLHLILSDRTRSIVGAREIALMQPHALLINTARAGLVDEPALLQALQAGAIAGAGLDVFSQEPLPPDHPLCALENVVLTPHLGYVTRETYRAFYADVVQDIAAFLAGKPIRVLEARA